MILHLISFRHIDRVTVEAKEHGSGKCAMFDGYSIPGSIPRFSLLVFDREREEW